MENVCSAYYRMMLPVQHMLYGGFLTGWGLGGVPTRLSFCFVIHDEKNLLCFPSLWYK